mgnify:CR=1 FL=1
MSTIYKTPGVYLKDLGKLPRTVTQVPTAVPVFVGYTETARQNGQDVTNVPVRISSLADYESTFGGAPSPTSSTSNQAEVTLDANGAVTGVDIQTPFYLYYSLELFFAQGGGDGYIVSVGDYASSASHTTLQAGFDKVEDLEGPTLLVCPDAALLTTANAGQLHQHMLKQCFNTQDRFSILDVQPSGANIINAVDTFRTEVGVQYLNYGAAYGPYLESTLDFDFHEEDISYTQSGGSVTLTSLSQAAHLDVNDLTDLANVKADRGTLNELLSDTHSVTSGTNFNSGVNSGGSTYQALFDDNAIGYNTINKPSRWIVVIQGMAIDYLNLFDGSDELLTKALRESIGTQGRAKAEVYDIIRTLKAYQDGYSGIGGGSGSINLLYNTNTSTHHFNDAGAFDFGASANPSFDYDLGAVTANNTIYGKYTGSGVLERNIRIAEPAYKALFDRMLALFYKLLEEVDKIIAAIEENLEKTNPIYAAVAEAIRAQRMILPPSGLIAGVYAAVDSSRGVWKASSNVALNNVLGPTELITNKDQEYLNVDPVAGKSINAIRTFAGRGIMVWGARTLDGNSSEWRYIPVRRLYIAIEESLRKATDFVVFEPNNGNTWLRVRNLIGNYLLGLWRQGALVGASPEEAFFIRVGLNESMTANDILEGRMVIEIGLAAVRPAEFIVIKFSQTLANS